MASCDILIRSDFLEAKTLGILLLSRCRKEFPRDLFEKARGWLRACHCGNWAATDALCAWVLAPFCGGIPTLCGRSGPGHPPRVFGSGGPPRFRSSRWFEGASTWGLRDG